MKVYVFLADGFEEAEALIPVDMLRRAGIDVKTVGITGKAVTGGHGITVTADITAGEVSAGDCDMIVLPGGMPGTVNLKASGLVCDAVRRQDNRGGFIGAICAAPSVLGELGVLKGRKATCYPGYEDKLFGAEYKDEPVVTDGHIITSKGAGTAFQFAFELINALNGDCEKIKAAVQWQ